MKNRSTRKSITVLPTTTVALKGSIIGDKCERIEAFVQREQNILTKWRRQFICRGCEQVNTLGSNGGAGATTKTQVKRLQLKCGQCGQREMLHKVLERGKFAEEHKELQEMFQLLGPGLGFEKGYI